MATTLTRKVTRGFTPGSPGYIAFYQVPVGAKAAVKGLSIAARGGVKAVVTVELCNNNSVIAAMIENAEIPPGDTLVVVGAEQTTFLIAGDQIKVTPTAGTVDAILSLAELT